MVIPLLGVKTRCADKSTAEHYEHTYIQGNINARKNKRLRGVPKAGEIIETFRTDGNYAVNSVPGYFWGTIFEV